MWAGNAEKHWKPCHKGFAILVVKKEDDNGNDSNKTQVASEVDPEPDGLDEVVDVEDARI